MFDSIQSKKLVHHSSKDHIKKILTIATSESLEICATSSKDGTLRIWDNQNNLIKILEMNLIIEHLVFSSRCGDIVFSGGKHLYQLPHENYLSPKYRLRIISESLKTEIDEKITVDDIKYELHDKQLVHPVSSVPFGSLDPTADAPRLEEILQKQMCLQLEYKDQDILRLKNNVLQAKRIVKKKSLLEYDDWEKHMNELLIDDSKTEIGIIPPHNILNFVNKYKMLKKEANQSQISQILHAYCMEKPQLSLKIKRSELYGFIPNSLVINQSSINQDTNIQYHDNTQLKKNIIKYIYPPEIYE